MTEEARTITLTINGQQITAKKGATILQAATEAGIYIPTLCHYEPLTPYGGCRLCIVEVEGMKGLPTSCTTPAAEGMAVSTDTPAIQELRRNILELILSEHPYFCVTCDRREYCEQFRGQVQKTRMVVGCHTCPENGRCELQKLADYIGIDEISLPYTPREVPVLRDSPFFDRDYNLCILCGRCVRVCQELRGVGAIAFTYRGSHALVGTAFGRSLEDSGCQFCGACVDACPTGALVEKTAKWMGVPERSETTTCPHCSIGCQLELQVKAGKVINSIPALSGINQGQACVKGRFGIAQFVHHPARLASPLIKRDGILQEATWDEASQLIADRLPEYRGEQFALLSSATNTNEGSYIAQKFARVVMNTNNIDNSASFYQTPLLNGLIRRLGSGIIASSIDEIENAACIVTINGNVASVQPIAELKIKKAVSNGAKLIVISPFKVELCRFADSWLQNSPGSEVALFLGMMQVIISEDLVEQAFVDKYCENFNGLKESLAELKPDFVEKTAGVSWHQIVEAARCYATTKPASIIYPLGSIPLTYELDSVFAICDLAMLTGNVGKPSSGVNLLGMLNNAQGAYDVGASPYLYPGCQPVSEMRQKFEAAWSCKLPSMPGLAVTKVFDAIDKGQVKALYIFGQDALLMAMCSRYKDLLSKLEFLVVQDVFLSDTAYLAHVVLPAASFAEQDGTFTNTEHRIQPVRKIIEPINYARPGWWIGCQIAQKMHASGFDFSQSSEVMNEIGNFIPQYRNADDGHFGMPTRGRDKAGDKAKFMPIDYEEATEAVDSQYPLILMAQPSLYCFYASVDVQSKMAGFSRLCDRELLEISSADAVKLGISDGDEVRIVSRHGESIAKAKVTKNLLCGTVCLKFHFIDSLFRLTVDRDVVTEPFEIKLCGVRVGKVQ
jgi:formate dehydrogenase alpha subunit